MARQPRVFVPGLTMHVIQRGAIRANTFCDAADCELFLEFLREAADEYATEVHALVLMSNHVHLMVTPRTATSLACTMQQIGRWYVPYFNRKYDRVGTLWQGRYRAIPIDTERYWLTCLRYIEQNPARAGMVSRPELHPWSSYHAHGGGEWPDWLVPHPVYLSLGGTPAERERAYRALCEETLSEPELETLRYAVHHGWAYGSEEFVAGIETTCGTRVSPRHVRPANRLNLSAITSGV